MKIRNKGRKDQMVQAAWKDCEAREGRWLRRVKSALGRRRGTRKWRCRNWSFKSDSVKFKGEEWLLRSVHMVR